MSLKPFASFDALCKRLDGLPTQLHRQRKGVAYRAVRPKWCQPKDTVSGDGAGYADGRWHTKPMLRVCYGALSPECALAESVEKQRYYSLSVDQALPIILLPIRYELHTLLDLTEEPTRKQLQFSSSEIIETDWRKANADAQEALTQAWGRAAQETGFEAILAPSAAMKGGQVLIVFPGNLRGDSAWEVAVAVDWPEK